MYCIKTFDLCDHREAKVETLLIVSYVWIVVKDFDNPKNRIPQINS